MPEMNTTGAGDAEQVKMDAMEIKDLVKQLDDVNISTENEKVAESTETHRKQVVTRGIRGKIKWFNIPRGYGFIEREDDHPDVFVHQSAVVRPGRKPRYSLYLKGGEDVEFDVIEGLKGLEAAAVTAPGGHELTMLGLKYNRRMGDYRRRKYGRRRRNNEDNNSQKRDENDNVEAKPRKQRLKRHNGDAKNKGEGEEIGQSRARADEGRLEATPPAALEAVN